jgi:hypothetical protein
MSLAGYYEECCQTRLGMIDDYFALVNYSRYTFDFRSHKKHNAADDAK